MQGEAMQSEYARGLADALDCCDGATDALEVSLLIQQKIASAPPEPDWEPEEAVVERVALAIRRCESIDGVRLVSGDGDGGWRIHPDFAELIARVALDAKGGK